VGVEVELACKRLLEPAGVQEQEQGLAYKLALEQEHYKQV
jgi:hypothetical protein